jgi:hypothetical protein
VESNTILDDVGMCSRPWQAAVAMATAAMDIEGVVGLPNLINWYVHLLLSLSTSTLSNFVVPRRWAREKRDCWREKAGLFLF